MRKLLPALAAVLALSACGTDEPSVATALDPEPTAMPSAVPAASGPVHTRWLATVLDAGAPELCLGPVAESWPPQCGGPPIDGWSWVDHRGTFESHGDTRWGMYALTGRWDGTTFTYESAVPAALYDAAVAPSPSYPVPAVQHSPAELDRIASEVGQALPSAQGAYPEDGRVLVDVTYDDGSLQAWADQTYGDGVVVVTSSLVAGG